MDKYEPCKVLGEGSFGKVYLMKDKDTRNLVCTKVIKLKNMPRKEQEATRQEVDLLRRMIHPNIVGYHDSFLYKNCLCIIMEYCDAGDLGDRVNKAKGELLPESKVCNWFVQIALGLHYMHSHRILHRDIKTQNVFILSCGRVVLGDLGISKVMTGTADFASTCIGTPYYMSPEIFQEKPYNHKSDVWALGCVLYELATLKHAFDANSLNGLAGKIIKGRYPSLDNRYSKNLRSLVKDMLATNPKSRPDIEQILCKSFIKKRVAEFLQDLQADKLHRQEKAMESLQAQLQELGMGDLLTEAANEPDGGEGKSSPSCHELAPPHLPPAHTVLCFAVCTRELKQQKHQLELEEEKRIAAEMGLQRLRKKVEERRRRASLSPMNSPERVSSPTSSRRPSILQRIGQAAGFGGNKSRPSSPSGAVGSTDDAGMAEPKRPSASEVSPRKSDGDSNQAVPRRRSVIKEGRGSVSPQPSGRKSSASPRKSEILGAENQDAKGLQLPKLAIPDGQSQPRSPRESSEWKKSPTSARSEPREQSPAQSPGSRPTSARLPPMEGGAPAGGVGGRGSIVSRRGSIDGRDVNDAIRMKVMAHEKDDDDDDVHEREALLEQQLLEAEDRCRELQAMMQVTRQKRRDSQNSGSQEGSLGISVADVINGDMDDPLDDVMMDDQASDFEDEPSPYAPSHIPDIQDAPTPKGRLHERIQYLRKKCIDGLGEEKFTRAFDLLKKMLDEDGYVEVDGETFDGADDSQVREVLVKVLGKDNLHYFNLLDQLALLEN
ncbi:unnamed protein product [Chrysoparadoxa australica]